MRSHRSKPRRNATLRTLASIAAAVLVAACGGGGGGGGGGAAKGGLVAPGGVSLLPPAGAVTPPNPGGFASDAAYFTDAVFEEVYDRSLDELGRIGAMLRVPGASGAAELLNAETYAVQANALPVARGASIRASATARGRSFAARAADYELWSVDSTRTGGPHDVAAWLPRVDVEFGAQTVFFDASISSSVSAARPFGVMQLDYAGAADAASLGAPGFSGSFASYGGSKSASGFRVFEAAGDLTAVPAPGERASEVQAAVELDVSGASGRARVFRRERFDDGGGDSGIVASEWLLEFDADTVVRSRDGAPAEAFSRAAPERHAWSYGLYAPGGPDAGERIDVANGLGVRTAGGVRGWLGPFGLWFPPGVTVLDGDDVVHDAWGASEEVHYTVRRAPGRLVRMTKNTLDLTELDDQVFEWFETDAMLGTTTLYEVTYDSMASAWTKLAVFDEPSSAFVALTPTELVDIASEGALPLYSTALGGPVAFVDGNTYVTWYELEIVDGSDPVFGGGATELELFGFMDCLRSGLTAAEVEAGDIELADATDPTDGHRFVFAQSDLTLYHDPTKTGMPLERVGLADGEVPASGLFAWGMTSGPLIAASSVPSGTVEGVWDVDELYVWETGANAWNAFGGLVDMGGDFVDVPLPARFAYRHSTLRDRNASAAYDGRCFVLEFDRTHGVVGFPRVGYDLDGDTEPDRFVPAVSLADGVMLGPIGSEAVVKAVELEEWLTPDAGYAGALTVFAANDLVVPDVRDYTTPAIGTAPVVVQPPRVVSGEIVGPLVVE